MVDYLKNLMFKVLICHGCLHLLHYHIISLLKISYAETSFLKRGRGACKVLYKLISNLQKVVSLDCESIFVPWNCLRPVLCG